MKAILLLLVTLVTAEALANTNESIQPLVIEAIECEGNSSTECSFIKGLVYLSPGENVDEEEIRNAKIRLSTLPNFKSTNISLKKGSEKGKVILVLDVEEASPYLLEARAGTSFRQSTISERIGGRIAHQNLFGKGKILDLELDGRIPLTKDSKESFYSRLQYIDPHLFSSKKYFFISGLTYKNSNRDYSNTKQIKSEQFGVDAIFGRRVWDFSYFSLGYQYNPSSSTTRRREWSDGSVDIWHESYQGILLLNYGWNSEDDPYFPTAGSRFASSMAWTFPGEDDESNSVGLTVGLAYRRNWTATNGSIWTLKIGGNPGTQFQPSFEDDLNLSLAYAMPIKASGKFGGIKRGRWYVEPGFNTFGYSSFSGLSLDPGLKAGVRLETETFGIIDLYAIGATEWSSK